MDACAFSGIVSSFPANPDGVNMKRSTDARMFILNIRIYQIHKLNIVIPIICFFYYKEMER